MTIYDLLTIWDVDSSWTEMEQLGLRILLAYASQSDITVCKGLTSQLIVCSTSYSWQLKIWAKYLRMTIIFFLCIIHLSKWSISYIADAGWSHQIPPQ